MSANNMTYSWAFRTLNTLALGLLVACSGSDDDSPTPSLTPDVSAPSPTPTVSTPPSADLSPGEVIDLSFWKITLPLDSDGDDDADEIDIPEISTFTHPDFFYVDTDMNVVFSAPNVATTTPNSFNARSELRQMLRGSDDDIGTSQPGNNFALAINDEANSYAAIGGKLSATLRVDHVAENATGDSSRSLYAVVIGQIHAGDDDDLNSQGFGWGNEPLKIFYKKFPWHENGSVFWTYERNLAQDDPDRTDIAYPVWGNTWEDNSDPGDAGISLGETFSYVVNVHQNTLYLSFTSEQREEVSYALDLSNNVDAYGNVDSQDFVDGYAGDWFYFRAGAYNQCNAGKGCAGTGVWQTDYANGDYAQATFIELDLSEATAP